jgi:hypothetical protein
VNEEKEGKIAIFRFTRGDGGICIKHIKKIIFTE